MRTIKQIENFETEVKGFNYISFNNIENFKSKLRSIGLNEDFIASRTSIYLFLISYLGVMTKEQLCLLTDLLEADIRTVINRLNNSTDYGNNGFLIDVENYGNDKDTVYYTTTKKAFANLMSFTDEDNIRTVKIKQNKRHLSKTNDFYLSLFKNSGCEALTIDYNDHNFSLGKVVPDGLIEATFNSNKYNIYLEQDNNTEKISTIEGKIQNYYNVCLHNEFPVNDTIKYYIFRFDMYLNLNQTWTCNQNALKSDEYKIYMSEISKLDKLRLKARECNDEFELVKIIQKSGIDVGDFIMTSSTFTKNMNRVIKLLSSKKSEFRLNIDNLKRAKRTEYICERLTNRISKTKNCMLKECYVEPFDFISEGSMYQDITRKTYSSAEYREIDARSILLRTNVLCGDIKIEDWLNKLIFNKDDKLVELINTFRGRRPFAKSKTRTQKYIKFGRETLCFSNFLEDTESEHKPVLNTALFMPTVSVSDYARIEYICSLNADEVKSGLGVDFLLIFIMVDNERDMNYYNDVAYTYQPNNGQILFMVRRVNL